MRRRITLASLLAVAGVLPLAGQEHQHEEMHEQMMSVEYLGENPGLPFSSAVRVGSMLYLSGQIGTGADGLVSGGIQPETRQTMENIKAVLEEYGSSINEVVKCTVFLADIAEWPAMNEVYVTYFTKHKPARSAVAGSGLALNARVEIECMATIGLASGG
jgi:2-iminobutanoate/2-iminopropanoate deaminase